MTVKLIRRTFVSVWLWGLPLASALVDGAAGQAHPHGEEPAAFVGASVGTARLPASVGMRGIHGIAADWTMMGHGFASVGQRWDPGPRGERDAFLTNMLGASARRPLGPGWLELTARASLEPSMGRRGYSLLLQTGESADGIVPLVDRQHPHDALVEISASYRAQIEDGVWAFLYVAPVGSPAIGPVPYMHRPSGEANPVAPISHHFLDATHVTHGVITGGISNRVLQAEVSWLNGREPDTDRWVPDAPALDSWAVRLTLTPGSDWAVQGSFAALHEPERLHPAVDMHRSTLSVMHHGALAAGVTTATTVAWGRNDRPRTTMTIAEARARLSPPLLEHYLGVAQLPPGADDSLLLLFPKRSQSALLVESSLTWRGATLFSRYERARKDELFQPPDFRHSTPYRVAKLDGGLLAEIETPGGIRVGLGATASVYWVPSELVSAYGSSPRSYMVFSRLAL